MKVDGASIVSNVMTPKTINLLLSLLPKALDGEILTILLSLTINVSATVNARSLMSATCELLSLLMKNIILLVYL